MLNGRSYYALGPKSADLVQKQGRAPMAPRGGGSRCIRRPPVVKAAGKVA
jgi:hypothetical protein